MRFFAVYIENQDISINLVNSSINYVCISNTFDQLCLFEFPNVYMHVYGSGIIKINTHIHVQHINTISTRYSEIRNRPIVGNVNLKKQTTKSNKPSLRALWKIELFQINSIVKYCRKKQTNLFKRSLPKIDTHVIIF